MTVAAARPHSDAAVALLEAADVPVGLGEPPPDAGWQGTPGASSFVAYTVMYPFTPDDEAASLGRPHAGLDYHFQLTCVGATFGQVELVMDLARAALIGATPQVEGRTAFPIYRVPLERPIARNDAVDPPIHSGVARFHFRSDPPD